MLLISNRIIKSRCVPINVGPVPIWRSNNLHWKSSLFKAPLIREEKGSETRVDIAGKKGKGFYGMEKEGDRPETYANAGVDVEAGNTFIDLIKSVVSRTYRPGVITDIGGFAGLFSLKLRNIQDPVLVSSTDGVGTKLKIAFMLDKHDTVGIDLVAMCLNDIMVQGATPLFFLDYISMGKLDLDVAQQIIKGIAAGCLECKCSLIGGETAEMPGFYAPGEYDLVGFAVGLADNNELIDGSEIAVGHKLVGVSSSGLHSNGYSLVRKIFFDRLKMSVEDYIEDFGRTLGEELLEPTRIYVRPIGNLRRAFKIYGICHITGGGFIDNIPRILPPSCKAVIEKGSWPSPPVFAYMQKAGRIAEREMMRTFNNGIGLVIIVKEEETDEILLRLKAMGENAYLIGAIETRNGDEEIVQFV